MDAKSADDESDDVRRPSGHDSATPFMNQGNSGRPLQITQCACHEAGLLVAGEIDLNGHDDWEEALKRVMNREADVHVHLAELRFIDVRGVTLLVNIAEKLWDRQRIVAHEAPPSFKRVIQVLWPDYAAGIAIEREQ